MPVHFCELERDLIEITGADTRVFLQGLISQDVEKVSSDRAAYGTLLTPQGKFLHDFILLPWSDGILIDCEGGRGEDLATRLSRFKLRANVTLTARPDLCVKAIFGTGTLDTIKLKDDAGECRSEAGALVLADPRTTELGARIVGSHDAVDRLVAEYSISPGTFADYDRQRIRLEVPDGLRDLELEKSTLLESNIDALNGIDWGKGCYMGQELTARTKYRGLVKRSLKAFRLDGPTPEPGTAINAGDKVVGEVRSARDGIILASIRVDAGDSGNSLTIEGAHTLKALS